MKLKTYLRITSFAFVIFCISHHANAQIVINEYSGSNVATIPDNYGNTPDWIELYNAGASAVNIGGYYMSDKISNPTKWAIPAGTIIASHAYQIIWASGSLTVGTNIHASFKLTQTKPEQICLADAGGIILDSMTINPTLPDHSRARMTDGAAAWGVSTSPTPGTSNTGTKLDYAIRPIMSVAAGFYAGAQTVSITSPGTGISIRYTTDGSTPTSSSTLYSTPVSISSTTVLRARAFSTNPLVPTSFVESNTYFINANHTVAVVSVFGDQVATLLSGSSINPQTGLEYFDAAKIQVAETEGNTNEHGNDSWAYNQRGFDYVSDDELGYNYALNYKVFSTKPRKSFQRIIFKAAANDNYPQGVPSLPAHIRDSYAHTLAQRGGLDLDARTWTAAIVYVNGQYWGVYDVREKVDDNDFTKYYYNQDSPNVQFLQTWGGTWSAYGGAQAQTDWNTMSSYILGNNMAIQSNYDHVDSLFSVKSFTDYFVFNSWLVTSDWLNWNTAWWRGLDPAGNKKKWRYTLWDLDAIMGHYINYTGIPDQTPNADPCNVETLGDPGGEGHALILNALLANPGYKQYYEARYIDLMNTSLNCNFTLPLYDSMIAVIDPEMAAHCAKWGGSYAGWKSNAAAFRANIQTRCNAMTQGMIDCYSLTGPYPVTFDVSPPLAGKIKINSITPTSYIFSGSYYGGIVTKLKATPLNTSYVFDHWDMTNHTPSPNSLSDSAEVTFTTSENVIAVFRLTTEPPGGEEVGVPTAFSPNGDNINDVLYVLGSVNDLDFEIYNRWGQQVFKTTDRTIGWDGKFGGKALNADVFAYRLSGTMPNGKTVDKKGNITLVR